MKKRFSSADMEHNPCFRDEQVRIVEITLQLLQRPPGNYRSLGKFYPYKKKLLLESIDRTNPSFTSWKTFEIDELLLERACLLFKIGKREEGEKDFEKVLQNSPNNIKKVCLKRIECYGVLRKPEEIVKNYEMLIQSSKNRCEEGHYYILKSSVSINGDIMRRLEDLSRAICLFEDESRKLTCYRLKLDLYCGFDYSLSNLIDPKMLELIAQDEKETLEQLMRLPSKFTLMKNSSENAMFTSDRVNEYSNSLSSEIARKHLTTQLEKSLFMCSQYEHCIKWFENTIKYDCKSIPTTSYYIIRKAQVYGDLGLFSESLQCYDEGIEKFEKGRTKYEFEMVEGKMIGEPKQRMEYSNFMKIVRFEKGRLYLDKGLYVAASEDFCHYIQRENVYYNMSEHREYILDEMYELAMEVYHGAGECEDYRQCDAMSQFSISLFNLLIHADLKSLSYCCNIDHIKHERLLDMYYHRGFSYEHLTHSNDEYAIEMLEKALMDFTSIISLSEKINETCTAFWGRCRCYWRLKKYEESISNGVEFLKLFNFPFFEDKVDDGIDMFVGYEEVLNYVASSYYNITPRYEKNFDLGFFYDSFLSEVKQSGDYVIPQRYFISSIKALEGGYRQFPDEDFDDPSKKVCVASFAQAHLVRYRFSENRTLLFDIIIDRMANKNNSDQLTKLFYREFGETSYEEYEKRIDFILQTDILSSYQENALVTIQWENGRSYHIMKYLLDSEVIKNREDASKMITVTLSQNIPFLDQKRLIMMLMGFCDFSISILEILVLHEIFTKLKMETHMFVLCTSSINQLPLKEILRLFHRCIKLFETSSPEGENNQKNHSTKIDTEFLDDLIDDKVEVEGEGSKEVNPEDFRSPLSYGLFECLVMRYRDIESKKNYVSFLDRVKYYMKVKYMARKINKRSDFGLCYHPFFENHAKTNSVTFYPNFRAIFERKIAKRLFVQSMDNSEIQMSHSNVSLRQMDDEQEEKEEKEEKEEFHVQKEVLMMKSRFFYDMFKFPGIESESKSVDIHALKTPAIRVLLRKVYYLNDNLSISQLKDELRKLCMDDLLSLLVHAVMYSDRVLQVCVVLVLDEVWGKDAIEIVHRVEEFGHYFERLPESILEFFIRRWRERDVPSKLVKQKIEKSIKKKNEKEE